MSQLIHNVQIQVKKSSSSMALFLAKLASGIIIGLTLALIGEVIFEYGSFSFVFVVLVTTGVFFRQTKHFGWKGVFVTDLIFVLLAMLLRMYILVAPGA